MNNEKLNSLFQEIREEKVETSIQDVSKWIALSAASVGLFGLLSKFKLSFLLTKKIIIMSSISIALGITCASIFLYSQGETTTEKTPIVSKSEVSKQILKKSTPLSLEYKNSIPENKFSAKPKKGNSPSELKSITSLPIQGISEFKTIPSYVPSTVEQNNTILQRKIEDGIAIEERNLKPFSKLEVTSAFDIFLSQGNTQSVRLEVDERYLDRVATEVSADKLTIKINKGGSINNPKKWAIYITVVSLTDLETSGAVDIKGETPFSFENFNLQSSGACDYNMHISAKLLTMEISGATDLDFQGDVRQFKGDISGACKVEMTDCKIENAEIDLSGASVAKVNVSGTLKAEASGASKLKNKGKSKQENIKLSGAAKYN
jgi:hypothetical protein